MSDERERVEIGAGDVGEFDLGRGPVPMTAEQEAVVRSVARTCVRCGTPVNDLIVAAGADGEEHAGECPGCGNPFTWRAPVFR